MSIEANLQRTGRDARLRPRVAFVLPGYRGYRCGVTDYGFWLAVAAAEAGWEVLVTNVHEFMSEAYLQRLSSQATARFRLGKNSGRPLPTFEARQEDLREELARFQPDWVSVQYSPTVYRYGRLIYPRLRQMARTLSGHRVSLTVHETWEVLKAGGRTRRTLENLFRATETWAGLRAWRPRAVFASNVGHAAALKRIGFTAEVLPLFSTIQPSEMIAAPLSLAEVLRTCGADENSLRRLPERMRLAVFFGRIRPDWNGAPLIRALREEGRADGKETVFVSAGALGYGEAGWSTIVAAAGDAPCVKLGMLAERQVSSILGAVALGVSSTPLSWWEKSSGCRAMIAHGLRIAFPDATSPTVGMLPPHYGLATGGVMIWTRSEAERVAPFSNSTTVWTRMSQRWAETSGQTCR